MNQKLAFQLKTKNQLFKFLKSNKERKKINFLNLHDIYQLNKNQIFRNTLFKKENLNFIDGFIISVYLSLTNLKKIPRISGPIFTRNFLSNKNLSENKTHFFIGPGKEDIPKLKLKFPHLKKIFSYTPSSIYIKYIIYSKKEIEKMVKLINKSKTDYVWVGLGCPKQNILSENLFKKTNAQYFMNIGAAIDFLVGNKAEAQKVIRKFGIEWFYRLVTDFKYSKKKVWRSFLGLKNITNIKIK